MTSLVFATVMLVLFCTVFPKWYKFTFGKNFYEFEGTELVHHGGVGESETLKSKAGKTNNKQRKTQASDLNSGDLLKVTTSPGGTATSL
jgi:hypothetical protein